VVPSESILRNVLIRVTPADLDRALQCWNERYGAGDESLAIDGKTMCNALDEQGQRTHVMSVVGQQSKICYTQRKVGTLPNEENRDNGSVPWSPRSCGFRCVRGLEGMLHKMRLAPIPEIQL
jgi:hypothetical protein